MLRGPKIDQNKARFPGAGTGLIMPPERMEYGRLSSSSRTRPCSHRLSSESSLAASTPSLATFAAAALSSTTALESMEWVLLPLAIFTDDGALLARRLTPLSSTHLAHLRGMGAGMCKRVVVRGSR